MTKQTQSGSRRGLHHARRLPFIPTTDSWRVDYRDWFERTESLLAYPELTFDAWLSIRDEHARLGRHIRECQRRAS